MDRAVTLLDRRVGGRSFGLLVAALAGGWLALAADLGVSPGDIGQFQPAVRALIGLHLTQAYPAVADATSPPGYPVLAAVPYVLLRPFFGTGAYVAVGAVTPLAVAWAALYLCRALGVERRSIRELVIITGVLLAPPVSYAMLREDFHPQDLAALALCLVGVRLAIAERWTAAGLVMGGALLTRQWAVLVVLPLLAAAPRPRLLRTAASALGVFLVGVLPFYLADPGGVTRALSAHDFTRGLYSLPDSIPVVWRHAAAVARVGPVLGAVVGSAVLRLRWRQTVGGPTPAALVGAVVACLALRPMLDVLYLYYLAPLAVFLIVADVAGRWRGVLGGLWLAVLWDVSVTPGTSPTADLLYSAAFFALFAVAGAAGVAKAWHRPEPAASTRQVVSEQARPMPAPVRA